MCFGDSGKKKTETAIQGVAEKGEARKEQAFNQAFPFFQNRMNNGLPYMRELTDYRGGTLSRSAAPRRAAVIRNMGNAGISASDPAYQATLADFEANLARGFDDQQIQAMQENEATKQAAAKGIFNYGATDPLAYYNLLAQLQTA